MSEMNLQNIHLPIMFPVEQTEITRNYGDGSSYVFRLDRETINEILMEDLDANRLSLLFVTISAKQRQTMYEKPSGFLI